MNLHSRMVDACASRSEERVDHLYACVFADIVDIQDHGLLFRPWLNIWFFVFLAVVLALNLGGPMLTYRQSWRMLALRLPHGPPRRHNVPPPQMPRNLFRLEDHCCMRQTG